MTPSLLRRRRVTHTVTCPDTGRRSSLQRLSAAAALATPWAAMPSRAADAMPPTQAAVGALLTERLKYQGIGYMAVQVDGKDVTSTVAGRRQAGTNEPLSTDALFEIGSITKTFTALLLADAVLRKQLTLDGAVEAALPDGIRLRDSAGAPIRWIDLATHRSGLPRLPGNMAPAKPSDPYADYGEPQLLDWLRRFKPERPRDVQWTYSNLGFGLLGYALGRALGGDYPDQLHRRVLLPLGLTQAFLQRGMKSDEIASPGHDAQGKPAPNWHFDVVAPAGALVMDGASLGRYAQAALGVLDTPLREAFALAMREHAPGPSASSTMGLAWMRVTLKGRTLITHDGGTFGFSSSLWLDPERQRASIVLANAMVEVQDIALHLLDPALVTLKDMSLTAQPAIVVSAEQLVPLAGTYALNLQFKIVVVPREARLFARATGQGEFELFASAPRRYFAKVTPLAVEFSSEVSPLTLTLTQNGQTLNFVREP